MMKILLKNKSLAQATASLLALASLVGCNSYLTRQEGITTHAGEVNAYNEAISVVDTWPDGFDDTNVPTDGKRQADAIEKYKNANLKEKSGSAEKKLLAEQ